MPRRIPRKYTSESSSGDTGRIDERRRRRSRRIREADYDEDLYRANMGQFRDGLERAYDALKRMDPDGTDRKTEKVKRLLRTAMSEIGGGASLR